MQFSRNANDIAQNIEKFSLEPRLPYFHILLVEKGTIFGHFSTSKACFWM